MRNLLRVFRPACMARTVRAMATMQIDDAEAFWNVSASHLEHGMKLTESTHNEALQPMALDADAKPGVAASASSNSVFDSVGGREVSGAYVKPMCDDDAAAASASSNLGFDGDGRKVNARDVCFRCGNLGHWAKDCPSKPSVPSVSQMDTANRPGQAQVPDKSCPCGGGVCKVFTAKTDRNAGRKFYRCPLEKEAKCGFFEWCSSNPSKDMGLSKEYSERHTSSELLCPCGAGACTILTANTERNRGRKFYKCPRFQAEKCDFFQWCDDDLPEPSASAIVYKRIPLKERMQVSLAGGKCTECGMEGHWCECSPSKQLRHLKRVVPDESRTFRDESKFPESLPNASSQGTGRDMGVVGPSLFDGCFNCGAKDHWVRSCPYYYHKSRGSHSTDGRFSCGSKDY